MCQSSLRLQVVFCILLCALVQTSTVRRDELHTHDILQCNQICRGPSCECRRFVYLLLSLLYTLVGVGSTSGSCGMISMGSGRSVNTSPGCGSHGIPRTFRSTLLSYRCPSGTPITDCTTCVPVSSMAMSSVVFTLTPTNTPLDHLDSNLCRVHSPKLGFSTLNCLPFQTHVGSATVMMWKNGRRLGTMLDQPSKQRASGFNAIPDRGSKKSLRVLASPCTDWTARSTSPLLLLSPLGESSGTTSPCQPFLMVSQRATILGS